MKSRLWFVLAMLLTAAASAPAQGMGPGASGPDGPPGLRGGGGRPGDDRPRREEAFRMVDAYVVGQLQESLALSAEQYTKVLPLVTKLQSDRRELHLGRGRLLREMRRLLEGGAGGEAQVVEKMKELKRLESDGSVRTRSDTDAVDAVLTPLQQAKFRLLELEVEQRMRELMRRARFGAEGAARRGPPGD